MDAPEGSSLPALHRRSSRVWIWSGCLNDGASCGFALETSGMMSDGVIEPCVHHLQPGKRCPVPGLYGGRESPVCIPMSLSEKRRPAEFSLAQAPPASQS